MNAMTEATLRLENRCHRGTGSVSKNVRPMRFHPAFMDKGTHAVYFSRFADGRMAPFHTLDGLPDEIVLERKPGGRVAAVKPSVISGFVRAGRFYTRDEAAAFAAACQSVSEESDIDDASEPDAGETAASR